MNVEKHLRVLAFRSELGWIATAMHQKLLVRLTFGHKTPSASVCSLQILVEPVEKSTDFENELIAKLQAFAAGKPEDLIDVKLDVAGMTPFQRRVLSNCRKIPFGATITYAQLAAKSGSTNAARAVGNVMASNRFPLIVPCHRVVATGSLGGYSSPNGLEMKRRLLAREGSLARLANKK